MERVVLHLDMDAFFAAAEERDQPWLKGKPIVIGADPKDGQGRGVVSTANYKAREYGIRSAMPISLAWKLSEAAGDSGKPKAIFLPGNHKKYEEISKKIITVLRGYAEVIEQASIDEAYLELAGKTFGEAENMAKKIKSAILEQEKLTCSIGIGPNKLIAKIASDYKKPNGLTVIRAEAAEAFIEPMHIRKIPGIGPKTEEKFRRKNIRIVADLKKYSAENLENMLGKWGRELYEKIRAIDNAPVTAEYEIKSIGEQETFDKDTSDFVFLAERLENLCGSVFARFQKSGFASFKTAVLTVRFADFETKTKSLTFGAPSSDHRTLSFRIIQLFLPFADHRQNPHQKLIRLLGVRIEKLA